MAIRYTINQTKEPSYLFVDGAYLDFVVNDYKSRISVDRSLDHPIWPIMNGYDKVFYYHCLPARQKNENDEDYKIRCDKAEDDFNSLRGFPGFHVFLGKAVSVGSRARQKGVDVQLAVHMLTFLHRGIVRNCSLLAGDSDFVPLVEALVLDGATVTVRAHRRSASTALVRAADRFQPITFFDQVFECMPRQFREGILRPDQISFDDDEYVRGKILRVGQFQGEKAFLWERDDKVYITHSKVNGAGHWEHIRSNNPVALELFSEDRGVFIDWD